MNFKHVNAGWEILIPEKYRLNHLSIPTKNIKTYKNFGFLMLLGGIERDQWHGLV